MWTGMSKPTSRRQDSSSTRKRPCSTASAPRRFRRRYSLPWVVVGAAVILFDPIFQGLAISLMAGEVASLLISRMAVPVLYYMAQRRQPATAARAFGIPEHAAAS